MWILGFFRHFFCEKFKVGDKQSEIVLNIVHKCCKMEKDTHCGIESYPQKLEETVDGTYLCLSRRCRRSAR